MPWESGLTGPFDQWPTGPRVREVLRQRDRRIRPVLAGGPRQHDARPAVEGPELLLPDRSRRSCDPMDQGAEVAESRQAVLRLLPGAGHARSGAAARRRGGTSTRASSIMGWDKYREEILARQKKLGIVPREHQAHGQGRHRARLGHADRRREEGRDPLSGALRGVCRADRLRDRPGRAGHRRHGRAGQHPDHLRHGRQRREPQRRAARRVQHHEHVQPVAGDAGVPARDPRRGRRAALRDDAAGRMVVRRQHAVRVFAAPHATTAAPPTARSCPGRRGSRRKARSATSITT